MAETPAILGQLALSATTLTDLYTVGASANVVGSCVNFCNRGTSACTVRLSAAPGGAADANAHYLLYDVPIAGNDFLAYTVPITLATTDKLRAYASTGNVSVTLFGVVNT